MWTLRGPRRLRLSLCEKWERNPAQGAPHATSVEPEGFKRDKTEIRRRMTLQIQAETLGRADQERRRSGGKQSTGARICPERRDKSQRGVLDPYLADRSAVNTWTRRLLLKAAEAASILARKLHLVG